MKSTDCQELLNMEVISSAFKNQQHHIAERVISCFYSCFRLPYIKWAKITYKHYPDDVIEFAADNSFTDGVLKLKESASSNKLYHSKASVKTVLFHYCRNVLLGYLKTEIRLTEKNKKLERFLLNQSGYHSIETEEDITEIRHENLMRALANMTVADRLIVQWRHIEEKSNDEIAGLLAITVASATNRIYRCMQRLRELVDEVEKKEP